MKPITFFSTNILAVSPKHAHLPNNIPHKMDIATDYNSRQMKNLK